MYKKPLCRITQYEAIHSIRHVRDGKCKEIKAVIAMYLNHKRQRKQQKQTTQAPTPRLIVNNIISHVIALRILIWVPKKLMTQK